MARLEAAMYGKCLDVKDERSPILTLKPQSEEGSRGGLTTPVSTAASIGQQVQGAD